MIDEAKVVGTELWISGWACQQKYEAPIVIHLYAGGAAGVGTIVTGAAADMTREAAVGAACSTTSTVHGFTIKLNASDRSKVSGKKLYIHGISVDSKYPHALLSNSGQFSGR